MKTISIVNLKGGVGRTAAGGENAVYTGKK